MNKLLRPINTEFYGDDYRWFFGTVINASPPAGLEGRVKVRIRGVHNPDTGQIPEKDLPWAQVVIPATEGGVSGYGRVPQLLAGAFVFGVFLDGATSQIPLVLGSIPHTEFPSKIQRSRIGVSSETTRLQNSVVERFADDGEIQADIQLRRQQSMKFFIDNGYSLIHAAAITGGLQGASEFLLTGKSDTEEAETVKTRVVGRIPDIDEITTKVLVFGEGFVDLTIPQIREYRDQGRIKRSLASAAIREIKLKKREGNVKRVQEAGTVVTKVPDTKVGIAAWDRTRDVGSRFNGLLLFSQSFQPVTDWRTYSLQLQYVLFELRNRFSAANRRLLNTNDIKTASQVINSYYLFTTNRTDNLAQIAYDEVFK